MLSRCPSRRLTPAPKTSSTWQLLPCRQRARQGCGVTLGSRALARGLWTPSSGPIPLPHCRARWLEGLATAPIHHSALFLGGENPTVKIHAVQIPPICAEALAPGRGDEHRRSMRTGTVEGEAEQEGPRRLGGLGLAAGPWQRGGASPAELWGDSGTRRSPNPHPGQPTMGVQSLAPSLAPSVTSLDLLWTSVSPASEWAEPHITAWLLPPKFLSTS